MASYYFSYNGVNLSNLVSVRAVETTVLPSRENHAITIWERPGSIYNSYRYGERDIVVKFLIRATKQEYNSNPTGCMENKLFALTDLDTIETSDLSTIAGIKLLFDALHKRWSCVTLFYIFDLVL